MCDIPRYDIIYRDKEYVVHKDIGQTERGNDNS